jgi:20S proteasome alpha/beta subunit
MTAQQTSPVRSLAMLRKRRLESGNSLLVKEVTKLLYEIDFFHFFVYYIVFGFNSFNKIKVMYILCYNVAAVYHPM